MLRKSQLLIVTAVLWLHPGLDSAGNCAEGNDYSALVDLFDEFREFQLPRIADGVPDYTAAAMAEQQRGLLDFQNRLMLLDTTGWPVPHQVDYHLVLAEMNGLEFHHQVLKPWARDPGFYLTRSGDSGPSMNVERFFTPLFELRRSESVLSEDQQAKVQAILKAIPKIYQQAKTNLTEAAGDLAELAIWFHMREVLMYDGFAERLHEHPDLAICAKEAGGAVRDYARWLEENKHTMTAPAGVGKQNYSWWMNNVLLSPWGWEESGQIIYREYDRIITFLKLEEHRNRKLPPLEVAMTEKAWNANLRQALNYVVKFLQDQDIMTVPEWVNPQDYYAEGARGGDNDVPGEEFLPENTSIDTKVRQREILPGETHEYVGHMLDGQRQERLALSPIRRMERHFNMGSMRLEGWAVALEELLMQVGVLDERPRKGREMEYLMNASHVSLAIPDIRMHANEINLTEARRLCAEIMPRGWSREDEDMVWFEMQSNLRNPGGFHSNVLLGKAYFMKLFRERAQELGDNFVLRDFIDEFLSYGIIPMSLIRWEMTGNRDKIALGKEQLNPR